MRLFPVVLIVDDSKAFRFFFKEVLKKTVKPVRIVEAEDGMEGLELYFKHKPDLVLLDLQMPKLGGEQVLFEIMRNGLTCRVIITTAYGEDQRNINHLIKMGAFSYISKPMNRMILMKTVTDALNSIKIANRKKSPFYKNRIQEKLISNSFVLNQEY